MLISYSIVDSIFFTYSVSVDVTGTSEALEYSFLPPSMKSRLQTITSRVNESFGSLSGNPYTCEEESSESNSSG